MDWERGLKWALTTCSIVWTASEIKKNLVHDSHYGRTALDNILYAKWKAVKLYQIQSSNCKWEEKVVMQGINDMWCNELSGVLNLVLTQGWLIEANGHTQKHEQRDEERWIVNNCFPSCLGRVVAIDASPDSWWISFPDQTVRTCSLGTRLWYSLSRV